MGFFTSVLGIIGFVIGIPIGLILGFFVLIYSQPSHQEYPPARPLVETSISVLLDLLPDIPLWMKNPDYERVDWFNKFISYMWPYLDKAVCGIIRSSVQPLFADYIGTFCIESIEFENLSLGTLPPTVHGVKFYETNEKELLFEPSIKWAGNPNIVLVLKVLSLRIRVQLVDLQFFAIVRVALKPLLPTFPCFGMVVVSLMEKPHVDFGLKVLGGDLMSIPGLYRYVQETIKRQVSSMYHWPQVLEIPILDSSTASVKKPVGLLHVSILRARNLLKKDLLGTSDPYVKLSLTGEKLPAKKTTIKKRNLNPEWNEHFKLIVKDPNSQVLQLEVFDWDKVGGHDRLGMQMIPLQKINPGERKEFNLDLIKNSNVVMDSGDKKKRGRLEVDLRYVPFREESIKRRKESREEKSSEDDDFLSQAGLLSVAVQSAKDVEGKKKHSNPYAVVLFRGEKKKTKMLKKTRDPRWNEEFQFTLEEPPVKESIRVEVMSKGTGFHFRSKFFMAQIEDKSRKLDCIPICPLFDAGRQCTRGTMCLYRHEINRGLDCHGRSGLENPFVLEVLARACNTGPLKPPEDQSIKTLYIRRLINSSVLEQDIRDHFCPYGEIESIVIFPHRGGGTCAFLTYTTRLAAEKAMLELSSWTDIKGQRVKLLWGPTEKWQHKMTGAAISSTQESTPQRIENTHIPPVNNLQQPQRQT